MKKIVIAFITVCVHACSQQTHDRTEIETAIKNYDRLLLTMNADSIAAVYDIHGELGNIAQGRDSIRKFLETFKNIRMLSQASTSDFVEIMGDSAQQRGSYSQVDVVDDRDTISVRGTYIALWKWNDREGWRIKRMETTPE